MDWFEYLTGFPERSYFETRQKFSVSDGVLKSLVNGKSYGIGTFEAPSLDTLRARVGSLSLPRGRLTPKAVVGDIKELHRRHENRGALFQVASQFNALEMVSPNVTPEDGITRYQLDQTQGPACAIAAGGATIYRNYFLPVGSGSGQTQQRQLDLIDDLGQVLAKATNCPRGSLWEMVNGYALCTQGGLDLIADYLTRLSSLEVNNVRGNLRVGIQSDVEVTGLANGAPSRTVSQVFCSALPVAYSTVPAKHWETFARFVLESAYEATLCAAVLNAARGASRRLFLTSLGGGAFGNAQAWIDAAIRRALTLFADTELEVVLVSYGARSDMFDQIVSDFTR